MSTMDLGSKVSTEQEMWRVTSLMSRVQHVRETRLRAAKIVALVGGMLFVLSVPAVLASFGLELFADAKLLPLRVQELCAYGGTLLMLISVAMVIGKWPETSDERELAAWRNRRR